MLQLQVMELHRLPENIYQSKTALLFHLLLHCEQEEEGTGAVVEPVCRLRKPVEENTLCVSCFLLVLRESI